jgi:hypothetical protein
MKTVECDKKNNHAKIVGSYSDDYDISHVHEIIINSLLQEKNNINDLNQKLKILKKTQLKSHTLNAKREIDSQIEEIEKEVEMIKNGYKLIAYKNESIHLIEQYISCKINDLSVDERLIIIDKYLKIAKKYSNVQVSRITQPKQTCMNCKNCLKNQEVDVDGILRCPVCNNEHQSINTLKHIDSFKLHQLNNENDMENFIKALNRYQGLQNNPPKILFTKLDTYFKERCLPSAEYIKSLPYNDRGKKGNVNKEMLYSALSSIGYSSYYEDVNLIGHIYWDWILPDLSGLKDKILSHYMITQKSFYKIPLEIRSRISSLGTSFRLFKHLQLVGVPVYHDDFKIAENQDSITNHNRLWKLMCDGAEDPEIYYIE